MASMYCQKSDSLRSVQGTLICPLYLTGAVETMTTAMLKAISKGYWKASDQQKLRLENMQNEARQLQDRFGDNNAEKKNGMVMKKETLNDNANTKTTIVSAAVVLTVFMAAVIGITVLIRKRRKQN